MSYPENREEVQNALVARVIENAPLRELIRVYSEAVTAAVTNLSEDDLVRSISQAGYADIIEHFELEVPADPETEVSAQVEGQADEVVAAVEGVPA